MSSIQKYMKNWFRFTVKYTMITNDIYICDVLKCAIDVLQIRLVKKYTTDP